MSEDRLLEVPEEALAAGLIEEVPPAVWRGQCTHDLIQETLSEGLISAKVPSGKPKILLTLGFQRND